MRKSTPGPWNWNGEELWGVVRVLPKLHNIPCFTCEANASLIAASPILYEFAKKMALTGNDEAKIMLDSLGLID
jgi:hypothetical protein